MERDEITQGERGGKTKTGGQRTIRKRSGQEQKPSQTKGSKRDRKVKLKPVNFVSCKYLWYKDLGDATFDRVFPLPVCSLSLLIQLVEIQSSSLKINCGTKDSHNVYPMYSFVSLSTNLLALRNTFLLVYLFLKGFLVSLPYFSLLLSKDPVM